MGEGPQPGTIGWLDLTVGDAAGVRDFYRAVVGWTPQPVEMDGYQDWTMGPPGGDPVAGVCHARGANAGLPPLWMVYLVVEDLDAALAACRARGGEVVREPAGAGAGHFAVIRDPAGAVCALWQGSSGA